MKLNVKTGDTVVIIAGKDKGAKGKVIETIPATGRVKVENANIVTLHKKPRSAQVPGGKFKQPAAMDVSNVQIVCPSCDKPTRVRHADVDGKHVRVCCKCGASLDNTAKIDKKKAKKAADAKPTKSKKKDEVKAETEEKKTKTAKTEEKPVKKTAKKAAPETETAETPETQA